VDARKQIGLHGEKEAANFLRQRGYKILDRRARVLNGDIDIVALDNRTVVFVEVRSRTNTKHGHPVETIDLRKKRRIILLANAYIKQHRIKKLFLSNRCRYCSLRNVRITSQHLVVMASQEPTNY
jgi:putative endonuclease